MECAIILFINMEAHFYKNEYFYVLNFLEDMIHLSKSHLEKEILEFPTGKKTGKTAILALGDREQIIHEKDRIITLITSKVINPIVYERHYKIENKEGNVILLNGMTYNLEY